MENISIWLNGTIEHHATWAGLVFALLAFGESLAFVGALVPATPVLFTVGALLGSGRLDPWQIVPAAVVGAILGYGLSFELARLLGRRMNRHAFLRSQRRAVARARLFFSRYGAPSLIFGRYVLGPFQSLLPFAAGVVRMKRSWFWPINILSGVIWVPVCLAPGYFAARGSDTVGLDAAWQQTATSVLVTISVGAVLACVVFAIGRKLLRSRA